MRSGRSIRSAARDFADIMDSSLGNDILAPTSFLLGQVMKISVQMSGRVL